MASAAPAISSSMLMPATAMGNSPTAVENRETTADVIRHNECLVSALSEKCLSVPFCRSVVTKMRSRAPSFPYFFSSSSRKTRNATAGSVVVPDLEITLTHTSRPSHRLTSSDRAEALMQFPAK